MFSAKMSIKGVLFLTLLSLTVSLDFNKEKEFSSFFLKPDPNFDITWFSPSTKFYVPFLSRLELNKIAEFFLTSEEVRSMSHSKLSESHCTTLELGEKYKVTSIHAFGNQEIDFPINIDSVVPGRWDYIFPDNPSGISGLMATSFAVLFDKKNGVLFVTQYMDGTKSFSLLSPVGVKTSQTFIKKAGKLLEKQYGFNPNYFVLSDYEKC